MALKDYEFDMAGCSRCSYCKFIPHVVTKHKEFSTVCPSIAKYNFHGYSGGGKLIAGLALIRDRIDYSDRFLDMIYQCQMCGACDVSCKNGRDMEPYEVLIELRTKCVSDGQLVPDHTVLIDGLKKEDNMMLEKKSERGNWAEGLSIKDLTKDKAEVLFHTGCRYSFDKELWPVARTAINLLAKAEVDIGIMGKEETCCGGRAYQIGYQGELTKYAEHNTQNWKTTGVKTVVTACADCYQSFKILYDKIGHKPEIEVMHVTQYLDRLIRNGRIKLTQKVPMTVTYHDPCHLGRLSEPWIHWSGTRKYEMGGLFIWDPPREFRRGSGGIYEPPRDILKSIPGLRLVEMDRIREYAWCCGAGGGVPRAYPQFSTWTAEERIKEARATGAAALVTACPWCARNFKDAAKQGGGGIEVYDIIELVDQAI